MVIAAALFLSAWAGLGSAAGFTEENKFLGSIMASPQICGIDIDQEKQIALIRRLEGETELRLNAGTVFMASQRIVREQAGWSDQERADFCAQATAAVTKLNLLRD